MALGCTPRAAWPVVPDPSPSLRGRGWAGSRLVPFPTLPSPPASPLPSPHPPVSPWLVAGQRAFHGAFSHCPSQPRSPACFPSCLCPHQSMAAQPTPAGPAGPFPGRAGPQWKVWWKNVDKFLICNTLGKSLLPLFEDECINKARRRWQRGRLMREAGSFMAKNKERT